MVSDFLRFQFLQFSFFFYYYFLIDFKIATIGFRSNEIVSNMENRKFQIEINKMGNKKLRRSKTRRQGGHGVRFKIVHGLQSRSRPELLFTFHHGHRCIQIISKYFAVGQNRSNMLNVHCRRCSHIHFLCTFFSLQRIAR